jgi:uncharacterized membrane protein
MSVTILSWIYIVMGTVGFIYHLRDFSKYSPFHSDVLLVASIRILAVVAGYFMLHGRNWARWTAILWIAAHVVLSFYNSWQQVTMHAFFFAIITLLLTRPAANDFFRNSSRP